MRFHNIVVVLTSLITRHLAGLTKIKFPLCFCFSISILDNHFGLASLSGMN